MDVCGLLLILKKFLSLAQLARALSPAVQSGCQPILQMERLRPKWRAWSRVTQRSRIRADLRTRPPTFPAQLGRLGGKGRRKHCGGFCLLLF